MLRDQMISFLQTTVIFLLLTNAVSILAATYAIAVANSAAHRSRQVGAALSAVWPNGSNR